LKPFLLKGTTAVCLNDLVHHTGDPAYQINLGILQHVMEGIAQRAADNGLHPYPFEKDDPLKEGCTFHSKLGPAGFRVLVEVNEHDLGAGIQNRRNPVHEYGYGYPYLVSETLRLAAHPITHHAKDYPTPSCK
jgi:hypothetical protein